MGKVGNRTCPECRQRVETRQRNDGHRYYSLHNDAVGLKCPRSGKRSH